MDYPFGLRLLVFSLTILSALALQADDNEDDNVALIQLAGVSLTKQAQALSGVKTIAVSQSAYTNEIEAIGKVLGIEPLLALRSRYQVMLAELKAATARLKQADLNLARQQELFRDGVSAKRAFQELTTQRLTEQAVVETVNVRLAELTNTARLKWGGKLGEWLVAQDASHIKGLLSGNQALLQITVPGNQPYLETQGNILIEPYGVRERARPAEFISRATQIDISLQGESYFFVCDGHHLRAGMKVSAWFVQPESKAVGMRVPQSALIWYMGQTFAYVKTTEDQFIRRVITAFKPVGANYLIQGALQAGDEVVSVGGQMLLSEEMRQHIPDED